MENIENNLHFVVLDDSDVFKKGFVNIGNTKLNRLEMRKILKPIEDYYFASYINNDDFFSQSYEDLKTSIDEPLLIKFNGLQQVDIVSFQVNSPHYIPDYQSIPWIHDICAMIIKISEILDKKYFNFQSISSRMDFVINMYDLIDNRIISHVREIFSIKPNLYEDLYDPIFIDMWFNKKTIDDILLNDKIRLFEFEFTDMYVTDIPWQGFIKWYQAAIRKNYIDEYMVTIIAIMFEFDFLAKYDEVITYMAMTDSEHPDEYNAYISIHFAYDYVIKIKAKYTPLLKMLIGYLLLLRFNSYDQFENSFEDKENIEPIEINDANNDEFIVNADHEISKVQFIARNLAKTIKYHSSTILVLEPCYLID
jgi:hypothetical protein